MVGEVMKRGLNAQVRPEVDVCISGDAGEGAPDIVGTRAAVADADLNVCSARGGGNGLREERRCKPKQDRKGDAMFPRELPASAAY